MFRADTTAAAAHANKKHQVCFAFDVLLGRTMWGVGFGVVSSER